MVFMKIFFLLLLCSAIIHSQPVDSTLDSETASDYFFPSSEGIEKEDVALLLEDLSDNPVDLNKAGIQDLLAIPFLSAKYAGYIIQYRAINGHIFSPAELYLIKEIPEDIIRKSLPYFTVSGEISQNKYFSDAEIKFRSRFRKEKSDYQNWGNLNRIKFSMGDIISAGFLTEKDEGENNYADFYSGFVLLKNIIPKVSLLLGDFNFESGQGLLFWGPYGMPKGTEVINSVHRKPRGIRAYSSSNETSFFRGIAGEIVIDKFHLRSFYSSKTTDGSVDSSGNLTRLITDGYHRTDGELKRKNIVTLRSAGINLDYRTDFLSTGFAMHNTVFGKTYRSINSLSGYSCHLDLMWNEINIFGETAFQRDISSFIVGTSVLPSPNIALITCFRKYNPDYIDLYSMAFGERNGSVQNETGFYTAIQAYTGFGDLSLYMDQYTFPNSEFPNMKGYDIGFVFQSKTLKGISLNLRYKLENEDYTINNRELKSLTRRNKENLRTDIHWNSGPVKLKLRGELTFINISKSNCESGTLLMQELRYFMKHITINFRMVYFKTDSFNSAIYQYEAGIPGMLENCVFFGEGVRFFTCIKLQFTNLPALYLKYSRMIKNAEYDKYLPEIIFQTEWSYK